MFFEKRHSLLLLVGVALSFGAKAGVTAEGLREWVVSHSSNGVDFSRRGILKLDESTGQFSLENEPLTIEKTRSLLEAPWYHVKVSANGKDTDDAFVLQTVPSCHLRRANFKDELQLTFPRVGSEEDSSDIISLAYTPLVSPLAPKSCEEYSQEALFSTPSQEAFVWTSKVQANLDTPGMTLRTVLPKMKPPPGLQWLQHPNARKGSAGESLPGVDDETLKAQDQKPFYMKYWYLIVPLVLANLMPAPEQPAAAAGDAPAADSNAPVAAAAGAAAVATGGSKASARRGKRS